MHVYFCRHIALKNSVKFQNETALFDIFICLYIVSNKKSVLLDSHINIMTAFNIYLTLVDLW